MIDSCYNHVAGVTNNNLLPDHIKILPGFSFQFSFGVSGEDEWKTIRDHNHRVAHVDRHTSNKIF